MLDSVNAGVSSLSVEQKYSTVVNHKLKQKALHWQGACPNQQKLNEV